MDDKDPSQTQDDGQVEQSATNDSIDLANVDPRLVIEDESTEEPVEEPEEVVEEVVEQVEEPKKTEQEPEVVSRRENKRIAELTRKLQESNLNRPVQPQAPSASSQIIGEGDYDLNQVNDLARQYGDQRYTEGIKQANDSTLFMTRLELDAPKVESKYEQLNPRSDNFDPGIADYTTQMFYKTVGLKSRSDGTFTVDNPNIRYEEFVDGFMEAVDTLASSKAADAKVNLAKRTAQLGVRPTSVAKTSEYQGDDPNKMTLKQLQSRVNKELGLS